ncbi:MAG: tetratricopeptide repeat protein [Alphaproteobacteria bacterium]
MSKGIIHNLFKKSIFYIAAFSLMQFSAWAEDTEPQKELGPFVSMHDTADDWLILNSALNKQDSSEIFKRWDTLLKEQPNNTYFLANDFMYSLTFGQMDRALVRGTALVEATQSEQYQKEASQETIASNEDRTQIVHVLNALSALNEGKNSTEVLSLLPQEENSRDIALITSLIVRTYLDSDEGQKKALDELEKVFPALLARYIELNKAYRNQDVTKLTKILEENPELYALLEADDIRMIVELFSANNMKSEAQQAQLDWANAGQDRIFINIKAANDAETYNKPQDSIAQALLILGRIYTAASTNESINIRNQIASNLADWISDNPFIQYNRAAAFLMTGNYNDGEELLKPLLDHPALSAKARLDYGLILQQHKEYDQAIEIYQNLSQEYPNHTTPLQMLADIYRIENHFKECIPPLDKAIELSMENGIIPPQALSFVFSRGVCLERDGQWEKAESDLKLAVEFAPENPLILNYLAYSWADKGYNINEAEQMLLKAIEKFPNDGNIIDSLGWVYFRQNRINEAVNELERAANLEPGQGEIFDHLGDALWYNGRKKEATYAWQRVLDVDGASDSALRAAYKLKTGKPVQIPGQAKVEFDFPKEPKK